MYEVMTICVIIHNMIVEQERNDSLHDQGWQFQGVLVEPQPEASTFEEFLNMHVQLRCRVVDPNTGEWNSPFWFDGGRRAWRA
jgi:hypothetical protein